MEQETININGIPMSSPSICISYANMNTTNTDVLNIFKKLNLGKISSIQFTVCTNNVSNERFYKIFIHFTVWYNKYNEIRIKLLNNDVQYIIYNFPWFWKITKFKNNVIERNTTPANNELNWREKSKKCHTQPFYSHSNSSNNKNWRLHN